MKWTVVIVESATSEVIQRFDVEANTIKPAEKIEDGININLDHDKYHTEIWG